MSPLDLLRALIALPSFSREEAQTATLLEGFFHERGIPCQRSGNNVWAVNRHFDAAKPTLLLNSHHDTVRPNAGWTRDPFAPTVEDGKLYGLGSNDAGGCLVALLTAFATFYDRPNLRYNVVMAATAEEEISGPNGIESLLPLLPPIDCAVVGEPTDLQLAVAEKGLLVLDGVAHGRAGHAARDEGDNAIYRALPDLDWFRTYQFPKVSDLLGPVKMTVTGVQAGSQHNVVPDQCRYVVDIRVNECYTLEEVLETVRSHVASSIEPRSVRLRSSGIALDHPLVRAGRALGATCFGSPTLSDQALLRCPSLKVGPGHSGRSHTADEFLYLHELDAGITFYERLLAGVLL